MPAIAGLDTLSDTSNEHPKALHLRRIVARQKGLSSSALSYLSQVFQDAPNHRESLEQAATIHFELNEYSEAEEYLNRLLTIDPVNEQYRGMLGAL